MRIDINILLIYALAFSFPITGPIGPAVGLILSSGKEKGELSKSKEKEIYVGKVLNMIALVLGALAIVSYLTLSDRML